MKSKLLMIVTFLLILTCVSYSKPLFLNCNMQRVIDGDTVVITYKQLPVRIRLLGVDTFETRKSKHALKQEQKFHLTWAQVKIRGEEATNFVKQFTGEQICLKLDTNHLTGFYGRYLGTIYLTGCRCIDNSTKSLNNILLEKHLAFPLN